LVNLTSPPLLAELEKKHKEDDEKEGRGEVN
jgi:hypothetical protein